ncbi:hypothetical protein E1263_28910 [Kribbella antibiotica]|uniref:Integral membrane protein n=1 Tax=Kribbella antibiotica TaxID=190195 RepID=A0A4R4Z6B5_9ACTN|nr:hypothetical protein [Kribbella antibiotica]TDD52634.1 hypothetical protein E1263_28910 [Kribbella antibiotica]
MQKISFTQAKRYLILYGVLAAVAVVVVVARAATHHVVPGFLWGRSSAVLATAVIAYWLLTMAERGAYWAYTRIRILTIVMPIAIVGVDLIPGLCPGWFAAMQAVCALAIVPVAVLVNRPAVREAFAA